MPVALLSDIMIISIIVIITLMIYRDMKFLLSPIPNGERRRFGYMRLVKEMLKRGGNSISVNNGY